MVWETAVGCSIQRTLPVALNVCSEESAVDAPASFRVVQGHRTDVCFLCTHPIAERDGQRPLKDTQQVREWQKMDMGWQKGRANRTTGPSEFPSILMLLEDL